MTVFFGIPVEIDEAMRIFGLEEGDDYKKDKLRLRDHLKQFGVYLFPLDKGQFIFGYAIIGLDDCAGCDGKSLVPYNQLMAKLPEMAIQFHTAMRLLNADMSEVLVYPQEYGGYSVKYPEPMVIAGQLYDNY